MDAAAGKQRCAGGAQDKAIINQIMLRFRPIAPRPGNSDGSRSSVPANDQLIPKKRVKRKYVRVKKKKKKESCSMNRDNDGKWLDGTVATPQQLEERQVGVDEDFSVGGPVEKFPCWIDFNTASRKKEGISLMRSREESSDLLHDTDRTGVAIWPSAKVVVESWITMESVTGTCEDGGRLKGCTDEERVKNLERDRCPGFISNGSLDQVQWINQAYKRMVDTRDGGGEEARPEVEVKLAVAKEKYLELHEWPAAFSCRVRVVSMTSTAAEKKTVKMIVPCDVWKMDFGGFAWRLDVEAALCLGR